MSWKVWNKWDTKSLVGSIVGWFMIWQGEEDSTTEEAGWGVLWLSILCDSFFVSRFRLMRIKFKRRFIWKM